MSHPLLELHDVRIDCEGRCAIEAVSFRTSGDRIGLLGAGRFVLEALAGTAEVTSGSLRVLGLELGEAQRAPVYGVARAWPSRANVTLREGLVLAALLGGCTRAAAKQRATRAVESLGLGAMSGQKLTRRSRVDYYLAGLAEAALFEPEVIVVDWPIGILEPEAWVRYGMALSRLIQHRRWLAWVPGPARHAVEQSWIGALDQLMLVESGLSVALGAENSADESARVRTLLVLDAELEQLPHDLEEAGLRLEPIQLVSSPHRKQSAYVVELARDAFGRPITEPLLGWCDRHSLPISRLEPLDRAY